MIKQELINKAKDVVKNIRIANIHPTGVLATRLLVLVMLVPIMLVVVEYVLAFTKGNISDDLGKLITTGINIIDHIFIPSVLTALVGFLALWVDKDGDGVPDQLEKEDKK
jgi:hypothetical protein|nr:MAG TPA: hypothetical protein [Caudoviricetes sp.]